MLRKILVMLAIVHSHSVCSVTHQDLWSCALKDNTCMNKYQLHKKSTLKTGKMSLSRPFILAIEGPKYHKLFEDCDVNKDGCIDMRDIEQSDNTCTRSCIWRKTMKDMLC